MKKTIGIIVILLLCLVAIQRAGAALVVPNEIQQPGTQPGEVGNLESPDKCDNCHGGYNSAVEPAFNWRGSMMANAGRDPIFWATLAVAEQDFDGAGDLCIRCHSTSGWYAGRSTPTDGSALSASDADGVECDLCHKMTNTDNSELLGVMVSPFIANDEVIPATGYYGSGMLSLWNGNEKIGPYSDANARHQFIQSNFNRQREFCGSCHDVSNPAVGDLAHNNGAQVTSDPVFASGVLGTPVEEKAAFNNFPYQYGIVERTFSEFWSGQLSRTLVTNFANLPADLKAGAIAAAAGAAGGNYADGTQRYFSCQTCHLRAVTGQGCNKAGVPVRTDLPLHDMTGGNYWMPDAILYQNNLNTLRLGGGLTAVQIQALIAGKDRALQQLQLAASLSIAGDTLKITNLTGHKLISGYPEGRRMWLNIKWYDAANVLLREDGAYGPITVSLDNLSLQVNTILDLNASNSRIYEAHYGMTQEWANQLLTLGYSADLPLSYDRLTGMPDYTLGDLAAQTPGTYHETFHFVLNNYVVKDNRIPPYGFSYDEARKRNALPVPADQYGNPGSGSSYQYWDEVNLNPPVGAVYADVRLLYQPTSWEYIQFLYLANNRQNAFLANEGSNLLDAWLNTGMAEPYTMASTTWGTPPIPVCSLPNAPDTLTATSGRRSVTLDWTASVLPDGGFNVYYDQSGKLQFITTVGLDLLSYKDSGLRRNTRYCYVVTSWNDCDGNGAFEAGLDMESAPSGVACATAQ
ncbi:MAG TPA: fibronectin type III domain-containing protein [Anaerolineales bacterium]|nr:fibronectin type III domain-containing protein [Anaerolineales bacterium]